MCVGVFVIGLCPLSLLFFLGLVYHLLALRLRQWLVKRKIVHTRKNSTSIYPPGYKLNSKNEEYDGEYMKIKKTRERV